MRVLSNGDGIVAQRQRVVRDTDTRTPSGAKTSFVARPIRENIEELAREVARVKKKLLDS